MSNPKNWYLLYDFDDNQPNDVMNSNVRVYKNRKTGAELRVIQTYDVNGNRSYTVENRKIGRDSNSISWEGTSKEKAIRKANQFMDDNPLNGGKIVEEVDTVYMAYNQSDAVFGVKRASKYSDNDFILIVASPEMGGNETKHLLEEAIEIVNEKGDESISTGTLRRDDYRVLEPELIKDKVASYRKVDLDNREVVY